MIDTAAPGLPWDVSEPVDLPCRRRLWSAGVLEERKVVEEELARVVGNGDGVSGRVNEP